MIDRRAVLLAALGSLAATLPHTQLRALETRMEELIPGFGMIRNYVAHPGQRAALLDNITQFSRHVREIGSIMPFEDANDDDGLWVVEFWRSREDYDAALTQSQLSALILEQRALIATIKTSADIKIPTPVSHD